MIDYGNGMIFPDSWAYGPPDPPEYPDRALLECSRGHRFMADLPYGGTCPTCGGGYLDFAAEDV